MAEPADKNTATGAPVIVAPPAAGGRSVVSTLLTGLGLLGIVTAGTTAGQFLYGMVAPHDTETTAQESDEAEAGKPAKKTAKKAPEGPPLYHAFEPLVVNFDEGGQMRFLQVTVELMSRDPKTIQAIEANTPMLRNNLLMLISNRDMKGLMTREGKEQLRALALDDVKATLGKVSEDSSVEDVYFTTFVMQ